MVLYAAEVDDDTRIMVWQEVAKLSPREQLAVKMELYGYTLQEIGDELGFSRQYAQQVLGKAKRAMRQNISREDIV